MFLNLSFVWMEESTASVKVQRKTRQRQELVNCLVFLKVITKSYVLILKGVVKNRDSSVLIGKLDYHVCPV